jgi:anti-anti-sigma regulatory factor
MKPEAARMWKIDKFSDGQATILRISGRINSAYLRELQAEVERSTQKTILDLEDVTLVDRTAVQFLGLCESNGVELRNCPLYIREWILGERNRAFK